MKREELEKYDLKDLDKAMKIREERSYELNRARQRYEDANQVCQYLTEGMLKREG